MRSPSYALPSSSAPSRALCTAPADDDDRVRLPPFADECLRGVGQVVFCNSPASGAMILGALAVGDPWLAVNAAVGAASATAAARGAGLDAGATSAGLFGYNGCLVGCAFSVFLGAPPVTTLAATVVGGGASAIVAAALKPAMGSVPQWTLAFNFTTLSALAYVRPLDGAAAIPADAGALELALSPLVGVSQIFVVNSPWAGAMMLAAIGHYSKGCAAHTLAGSCVGVAAAAAVGAPAGEIAMGLWGFNPALTSLAVSVFFVNCRRRSRCRAAAPPRPPCSSAARRRRSAPPPAAPPSRCRSAPSRAAATCSAAPRPAHASSRRARTRPRRMRARRRRCSDRREAEAVCVYSLVCVVGAL